MVFCSFADKADTIDRHNITIDVTSKSSDERGGQVFIRWSDPPSPNGLIVLYDIELVKTDVANVSITVMTERFVVYNTAVCE